MMKMMKFTIRILNFIFTDASLIIVQIALLEL